MQFEILLLAQGKPENPIRSISRHLQNSQGITARDLMIFAAIGAAIALLVLLLTFAGRAMGWWTQHSSGLLFRELCGAHELDRASRGLLQKLARGHQMKDLALIFAMPERFEEKSLPPGLKSRAAEVARLREQLFGSASG